VRRILLPLAGLFALLLPFCSTFVHAATNGTATGRFTSSSSNAIIVYGLVGAYRCSFTFDAITSPGTGPIDVKGGYNGSFQAVTVSDVNGGTHSSPFTPVAHAQYYFGVQAWDTVELLPDATWSGQDATGTLACVPAGVALATQNPVTLPSGVAINSLPPVVFATWQPVTIQSSVPAPAATWPVTTPAPCATPNCNNVAWQGTSPWVVSTINPSLPAPQVTWPVTTPAPAGTLGVVPQAACAAAYPCGYPTPIPFPTIGTVAQTTPCPGPSDASGNCKVNVQNVVIIATPTYNVAAQYTTAASPAPAKVIALGYNAAGSAAPVVCQHTVTISLITTQVTETVLVPSAAGKAVYVCSIISWSAGTGIAQLETSATNVCGSMTTLAALGGGGAAIQLGTGVGTVMQTAAGVALCATNTSTAPTSEYVTITYEQFLHSLTPEQIDAFCSVPHRCALYGLFKHLNHILDHSTGPIVP
jgi:hypothetical protein